MATFDVDFSDENRTDMAMALATITTPIERLALNGNEFDTICPDLFRRMTGLTHLALHRNMLTRVPDDIRNLGHLRWLSLHHNSLDAVPDLTPLTKLERLSLHVNKLRQWPSLPVSIRVVSVFDNALTGVPDIRHLENLETVSIASNRIQWLNVRDIIRMPMLRCMYVYDNPFDDATLSKLAMHPHIFVT